MNNAVVFKKIVEQILMVSSREMLVKSEINI